MTLHNILQHRVSSYMFVSQSTCLHNKYNMKNVSTVFFWGPACTLAPSGIATDALALRSSYFFPSTMISTIPRILVISSSHRWKACKEGMSYLIETSRFCNRSDVQNKRCGFCVITSWFSGTLAWTMYHTSTTRNKCCCSKECVGILHYREATIYRFPVTWK